jgi:hypothetical protein
MGQPERIVTMTNLSTNGGTTKNPTQERADGGHVDGVGQCSQHSAAERVPDEWSEHDGIRWGIARPPILGEVSSEDRPAGPVSTRLLMSTAATQRAKPKPRRLPRFWTPADGIAIMVPRSPVPVPVEEQAEFASYGGDDFAAEARARSKARKKAKDKTRSKAAFAFKAAKKALTPGQTCPDCGVELCDWHVFDRRPVFALRDGKSVLVCRKCNGGKDVSPEAQEAAGMGRKGNALPVSARPAYLPSPESIAAECEAIRSTWASGEAARRREGVCD